MTQIKKSVNKEKETVTAIAEAATTTVKKYVSFI